MVVYGVGFRARLGVFFCVLLMFGIILFFASSVNKTNRRRRQVERELGEKEERYRELFDYSQGMICIHDLDGVLTTVNPAALRSLEYDASEMVGQPIANFMPYEHRVSVDSFLRQIETRGMAKGLLPVVAKSGKQLMWSYNSILVTTPGKQPYVIGHAQDVTELVAAQMKLKNISLTDDLTGLYNRRGFMSMAEQQLKLERHAGTARGLTMMFADMDGLKKINDVYGHEAGSDAIIALSKIINSALRDSDLVARWGGDEFVILTIGSRDEDADAITERIYRRLSEYNAGSDKPYRLECSIGIAPISLDSGCSFETMIARADSAMYAEKRRRKAGGGHVPPISISLPDVSSQLF